MLIYFLGPGTKGTEVNGLIPSLPVKILLTPHQMAFQGELNWGNIEESYLGWGGGRNLL